MCTKNFLTATLRENEGQLKYLFCLRVPSGNKSGIFYLNSNRLLQICS
jgi:hypothetical protein